MASLGTQVAVFLAILAGRGSPAIQGLAALVATQDLVVSVVTLALVAFQASVGGLVCLAIQDGQGNQAIPDLVGGQDIRDLVVLVVTQALVFQVTRVLVFQATPASVVNQGIQAGLGNLDIPGLVVLVVSLVGQVSAAIQDLAACLDIQVAVFLVIPAGQV